MIYMTLFSQALYLDTYPSESETFSGEQQEWFSTVVYTDHPTFISNAWVKKPLGSLHIQTWKHIKQDVFNMSQ